MHRANLLHACASCAICACVSTYGLGQGASDSATTGDRAPDAPVLELSFSQTKQFEFTWSAAPGSEFYQILERVDEGGDYRQLGEDIVGESRSLTMPLHLRFGASYILRACNGDGCSDSAPVDVVDSLAGAVGYVKAANADGGDAFGISVAVAADGDTLAVGAYLEDSRFVGVELDNSAADSGAVYVFVRGEGGWTRAAYLKAPNVDGGDRFGRAVALSADGRTLAVGAPREDSAAVGVDGEIEDDSEQDAGGAYVYVRSGDAWSHQAYLKAASIHKHDWFGGSVALSADGNTLAIGARLEKSAGAVHVFGRTNGIWSAQAHLEASNAEDADAGEFGDCFGGDPDRGRAVALSADGNTLAVGAPGEDSAANEIDGEQSDDSAEDAGAVYVFTRAGGEWSQQAYIKAANAQAGDRFGTSVALSADGHTLAVGAPGQAHTGAVYMFSRASGGWAREGHLKVIPADEGDQFGTSVALSADGQVLAIGAPGEDGASRGIGGAQADNSAPQSGAVYVLVRAGSAWPLRTYVKASNTKADDNFGADLALSSDADLLAVGAYGEASAARDINGDQADDSAPSAGAVYLF